VFDLCNEISLLAKLGPHENIVSIRGVCRLSVSQAYRKDLEGYFFVMEKLEDTLGNRLKEWRQQVGRHNPLRRRNEAELLGQMNERLEQVAIGIARAMSHLHSMDFQIAIRDLKPQNVGFDKNGVVKLFDLGMARHVHDTDTAELAGTFRYISPEAIMGHRIGLNSDVYSFGVILYELATLLKPFDQYFQKGKLVRKEAFYESVVVGGWRPSLSTVPCRATRRLIEKCWDPAPRARPCFDRIYFLLNQIVSNKAVEPPPPPVAETILESKIDSLSIEAKSALSPEAKSALSIEAKSELEKPALRINSSFRGLFRGLKPSTKEKRRMCSDTTNDTTSRSTTTASL
jgi:serine/threonine protein kinase